MQILCFNFGFKLHQASCLKSKCLGNNNNVLEWRVYKWTHYLTVLWSITSTPGFYIALLNFHRILTHPPFPTAALCVGRFVAHPLPPPRLLPSSTLCCLPTELPNQKTKTLYVTTTPFIIFHLLPQVSYPQP